MGKIQYDYEFGVPPWGELVELYASLSEPAEIDELQSRFDSSKAATQNAPGRIFLVSRDHSNNALVGVLRGWVDYGTSENKHTTGIIYDIAVRREYQNKGAGTGLTEELQHGDKLKNKGIVAKKWVGYPYRTGQRLDRNLNIIGTIYGISFLTAFTEILVSVYKLLWDAPAGLSTETAAKVLLALTVALVGCRFYFAGNNIRRYFLQRIFTLEGRPGGKQLLLVHLPALFVHAVLFFFLCSSYKTIVEKPDSAQFQQFSWIFGALLLVNIAWLMYIEGRPAKMGTMFDPEEIWLFNNALFLLLAAVYPWIMTAAPFQGSPTWSISGLAVILGTNSAIDLLKTRRSYLLGDALSGG